jgi:hypothetical protein
MRQEKQKGIRGKKQHPPCAKTESKIDHRNPTPVTMLRNLAKYVFIAACHHVSFHPAWPPF